MRIQTLILAGVLLVCGASFAQTTVPAGSTGTPELIKREGFQQQRINQGLASGQLNSREAARLQARQNKLAANGATAKSDGVVTKKERARLHHQADNNSQAILKQKHDAQKAKP